MVASEVTEGLKKYNSHTKKLIIQINWAALDHFFFFFFCGYEDMEDIVVNRNPW